MYPEIGIEFDKILKLIAINDCEMMELQHILFEIWEHGYEQGYEDSLINCDVCVRNSTDQL